MAAEGRVVHAETQRFIAGRMKVRVHTVAVGHLPVLTAPEAVVDIVRASRARGRVGDGSGGRPAWRRPEIEQGE